MLVVHKYRTTKNGFIATWIYYREKLGDRKVKRYQEELSDHD